MCDNNGDPFIALLHNVMLAPDLCNRLFSIITLMNLGHTCLLHKGFCTLCLIAKEKNSFTLPHSAQRKHEYLGKIKEISKTNKLPSRKQNCFIMITSQIRSQIHHIIVVWGYC